MSTERQFPIQLDSYRDALGRMVHPHGGHVPWSIGEEAWERYAARYGREQSCERMAARAGFSEGEMDEFRLGWREFLTGTDLRRRAKCR